MEKYNINIREISETKRKGQGTCKLGKRILMHSGKTKHERTQSEVGILQHGKNAQTIGDKNIYKIYRIYQQKIIDNYPEMEPNHNTSYKYAPDISKPNEIKNSIHQATEVSNGKWKIHMNGKNSTQPWLCQEVKNFTEVKRKSDLTDKSTLTQEKDLEYIKISNRVNSKIKAVKRKDLAKFTSDMDHDLYGAKRQMWNML
ncbi:hypothetical protein HUJ05_007744 [Dendroctonus ponderosae]|nr:hypothetical protein HUJ05_007744 [Dendroctonus ponderosae]